MAEALTLMRDLRQPLVPGGVRPGYHLRRCQREDGEELGALYFDAYEPGTASDTLAEARADIAASFDGDYGTFAWDLSYLVETISGPVAAALTVVGPPWDGVPDGPFIIEVFTRRDQRRLGLARAVVERTLMEAGRAGADRVGLRVMSDNVAARQLYSELGFRSW